MEDLLGIIIFVVFIALRVMGDRKKGMKKEPGQKSAPTAAEQRRAAARPQPPRAQKPGRPAAAPPPKPTEKPAAVRKVPGPVTAKGSMKPFSHGLPKLAPLGEGMSEYDKLVPQEGVSDYDSLPPMEGIDPCHDSPETLVLPPSDLEESETIAPVFVDPDDVRKAVIWSEILQKPRFKNRYPGYRKIS